MGSDSSAIAVGDFLHAGVPRELLDLSGAMVNDTLQQFESKCCCQ